MSDQKNMAPNNNPNGYAIDKLTSRVASIEERNKRVQADKAWEASWVRRGLLILFTYLAVGLYLSAINVARPWLNAIVPSVGFLLSTLTLPFFKQLWVKRRYRG